MISKTENPRSFALHKTARKLDAMQNQRKKRKNMGAQRYEAKFGNWKIWKGRLVGPWL